MDDTMQYCFDEEFLSAHRIEQIEDGMLIEHLNVIDNTQFVEDSSDYVFGSMTPSLPCDFGNRFDSEQVVGQLCAFGIIDAGFLELEDGALLPAGCGVSGTDVEHVLNLTGYDCDKVASAQLTDLVEALAQEERVLCCIQCAILQYPSAKLQYWGPDRLVEIRGIDLRQPQNASICIIDADEHSVSGAYPLETFLNSWNVSDHTIYLIHRSDAP